LSEEQPLDTDLQEVHTRALQRFDIITSALQEERALSLEDRRFVFIAGAPWEGDWGAQFENTIRVSINKVARGHDKIINDYRANRFVVNFRPVGDNADEDTAELLNGLMFADMHRCKGQQALDNAFGEGVAGGFGAWRLCNEYEDEYDPENEGQVIGIYQITDADQRVYFDLDAKMYDKSDARYAYVMHGMTPEAYKEEYKQAIATWPENREQPNYFNWFEPEITYITEYYEVEEVKDTIQVWINTLTSETKKIWLDRLTKQDIADLENEKWIVKASRKVERKRVHKYIMSGAEVLEDCGYIAGSCIPIIPFYGRRVFIDNIERFKGHVRDAKDPQRVYNAQVSKLVETASLSPREIPIFAPDQMAGLGEHWANMNIDRNPYALAHPLIDPASGSIVSAGPIGKIESPQLSPVIAALMQQTASDIAEITSADEGATQVRSNVSGDAMDIAAMRTDEKSFIYRDNFRLSMQRFGEVYYGMARDGVYIGRGRKVQKMNESGASSMAELGELVTDPNNGETRIRHDLTVGKYDIIADVTEATATRRDKTVKSMLSMAQTAGTFGDAELAQAGLLTAILNMDGEGTDSLREFARKKAVAIGLEDPTDEEKQAAQDQQQAPDPQAMVMQAQAKALMAQADKLVSDATQSKTKAILNIADAQKTINEAGQIAAQALPQVVSPQENIQEPPMQGAPLPTPQQQ